MSHASDHSSTQITPAELGEIVSERLQLHQSLPRRERRRVERAAVREYRASQKVAIIAAVGVFAWVPILALVALLAGWL